MEQPHHRHPMPVSYPLEVQSSRNPDCTSPSPAIRGTVRAANANQKADPLRRRLAVTSSRRDCHGTRMGHGSNTCTLAHAPTRTRTHMHAPTPSRSQGALRMTARAFSRCKSNAICWRNCCCATDAGSPTAAAPASSRRKTASAVGPTRCRAPRRQPAGTRGRRRRKRRRSQRDGAWPPRTPRPVRCHRRGATRPRQDRM